MKTELIVPLHASFERLAVFPPPIAMKAKGLANEITDMNIRRKKLRMETGVAREHIKNNTEVRKLLDKCGIVPARLSSRKTSQVAGELRLSRQLRK